MPSPNTHHESSAAAAGGGASSFKRSPRLFSLLLKATIMALITCLFFVFLGVAAIILLNLCLAGGLLHRHGSLSPDYDDDDLRQRNHPLLPRPGLSPSDIRRVPKFRFFSHGKIAAALGKQREANSADCAICIDEVKEGQWCRRLVGCGHVFHKECVDPWLARVAACPLCRRRVRGLREGGVSGRDSKVDGFQGLLGL